MSSDVSLRDPETDTICDVPNFAEGGIQAVGGSDKAWLNITWNYGEHFCAALHEDGLEWLRGKRAGDCIEQLQKAVIKLGLVASEDYWDATPGNAGHALNILLGWAHLHPDAIFDVD